ncbi:MAG TPA: aldo/keto reductase [Erysipelothrix sp.]|nr:aldo/keto reductase [Erysipelothrix sp.]
MKQVLLNSQHYIDLIGSGTNTFGKEGGQYMAEITMDTTELNTAIKAGYRHFDTAVSYRNESVIGKAIQESGIARDEFFITSKIPTKPNYVESTETIQETIDESLKSLGTKYIDLYLIHHPADNETNLKVWKVLEKNHEAGLLKTIGVSNFNQDQLQYIMDHSKVPIAVNQIESHPGKWQEELIAFCQNHDIVVEAWGPLTRVSDEAKAILNDIGSNYHKTWAQVILNYQVSRQVVVIPKSHNAQRQKDNLNVFDFQLTPEERERIQTL